MAGGGKLPWSCMSWKGLDAEGLAEKQREKLKAERLAKKRRKQRNCMGRVIYSIPSVAYCSGDPGFWRATLRINWEDNAAYEARRHGAKALGITVSRTHLRALLPGVPDGNEKAREATRDGARAMGIRVSRAHLRALLPKVPNRNEKAGPQRRRVLEALKKLYPPDGKVPDDVPTGVVRGQVTKELSADSRNREAAAPSWDTVNRALGRG